MGPHVEGFRIYKHIKAYLWSLDAYSGERERLFW